MDAYLGLLDDVLTKGKRRNSTRTGKTISLFGYQNRYPLQPTFPAVTTKRLYWNGVVTELLWFLRGDTNVKYLHDNNVHIWDEWQDEGGNLGPIYGRQWRRWETIDITKHAHFSGKGTVGEKNFWGVKHVDQIDNVIQSIKTRPESRRHLVTTWNPGELENMRLEPCHDLFQFHVDTEDNTLSCQLYQRSGDAFLGVPFNVASYSLLTCMVAQVCDLKPGEFIHTFGDIHIYENHLDQVKTQLSRKPLPAPTLWLDPSIKNIDDFRHEHILLKDYQSHPAIKAPVAV